MHGEYKMLTGSCFWFGMTMLLAGYLGGSWTSNLKFNWPSKIENWLNG